MHSCTFPGAPMAEGQRTILVADASLSAADALSALLSRDGYRVLTASTGEDAVRVASSGEVDLVLVDAALPAVDGLMVLRAVRALPGQRLLPVVVMTAPDDDAAQRVAALKLGADHVFAKPWEAEELLARIGRLLRVRGQFDEVLAHANEQHHLSVTDALTQVHTHRFFQDRLKEEFRRAQRYDDALALVLVDLDHFKSVNDRHGAQVGDQVLKDVASSIRTYVRDTDLLARYGGEEFAILLPRTHLAGALTVAERVWRGIAALHTGTTGQVRVTASLGVSGYPSRSVATADQLLRSAGEALFRAKREGRNKICLFQQLSFFDPPARAG